MVKKIFGIYLAKLDLPNSEAHARLELPASPWELHDSMDKVRLQENEELYLEIDDYVKTGVFEKGASKIIRNASELREQADYEDFYEATQEEASDVFMQASQFILEVECYLHSKSIL